MQRVANKLINDAPLVVVGRSFGALYWASILQQRRFTILLTSAEYAVDPYVPAMLAVGFPMERLIVRPREVLKPGTVFYGRMIEHRSNQIHIALQNGSAFWSPVGAVLNMESPPFLVNGVIWGEGFGTEGNFSSDFLSKPVVLAGHRRSAATLAIELLVNSSSSMVTWMVEPDEMIPVLSMHVVDRLGGKLQFVRTRKGSKTDTNHNGVDRYKQTNEDECLFVLPDYNLSQDEELVEKIFDCVSSNADRSRQDRSYTPFYDLQTPIVLSQKAKNRVVELGIPCGFISENNLEHRVNTIHTLIKSFRGRDG